MPAPSPGTQQLPGIPKQKSHIPSQQPNQKPKQPVQSQQPTTKAKNPALSQHSSLKSTPVPFLPPLTRSAIPSSNLARKGTNSDASSDGGSGPSASSLLERQLYYSKPLIDNISESFDEHEHKIKESKRVVLTTSAARNAETGKIQYKEQVAGFQRDDDESLS